MRRSLMLAAALLTGIVLGGVADRMWLAQPARAPIASPYVAQQASSIRGLSAQEVSDLLAGRGAGFARTAELNSYPGPRHVLDMRAGLDLTPEQGAHAQRIFDRMQLEARRLGGEIVERERRLSDAFAAHRVAAADLAVETEALGRLYGRLRATHLRAHVELTALLTPSQIARYDAMRGYGTEHQHGGT